MKALVLAGGFGTRLKEVVSDVPKPMAPVAGRPFLEYQLRFLKKNNIDDVVLAVHHLSGTIKSHFGNGHRFGVNLTYSEEEVPLGTGGAIKKAERYLDAPFLVMNGDSYSTISLESLLETHNSSGAVATVSLAKVAPEERMHFGGVVLDGNKITNFSEKSGSSEFCSRGLYLCNPSVFRYIEPDKKISIETEVFPRLVNERLLSGCSDNGPFIDIGRPETFAKFKEMVYQTLLIGGDVSIRDAMNRIEENGIDLLIVTDKDRKLIGVLNDKIIRRFLLKDGKLEDRIDGAMVRDPIIANKIDSPERRLQILGTEVQRYLPIVDEQKRVVSIEFRGEELRKESFPVVRGKAPLRVSFAGGGTDLPYFFEKYGGVVISSTIDKYCHATAVKRADSKVVVNLDGEEHLFDLTPKMPYDGRCNIVKAVTNILKPDFGFDLNVRNDVPHGRGLGSSASLGVLVASLVSSLQGVNLDDHKLAEIARKAEVDELKIKGGLQDQFAIVTGGFNFMEFNKDNSIIYPLRLKGDVVDELSEHISLCYVGAQHYSGDIHTNQERSFRDNESEKVAKLHEMKRIAVDIKNALLTNNLQGIGHLLHESWLIKRSLEGGISNPNIDRLYETGLQNGAYGGKLLGAGGGGYIMFYHNPLRRNQLYHALRDNGGEPMDFNFEQRGTSLWKTREK